MSTERLTWIQTALEPSDVHMAMCGPFGFEIRATADMGYRLRMWQIRPEDSPILFWDNDGYDLEHAKTRADRLAAQYVPPITAQ
jgi:hypothetical protein